MKITVNNKLKIIAIFKLFALALIILLLFEYIPILYENIFGNKHLHEVEIVVALLAFGALLYSSLDCKKKLDYLYEMEDRDKHKR